MIYHSVGGLARFYPLTMTLRELNNYFAELCTDDVYTAPTLLEIGEEVEIPTVSERVCVEHSSKD